MNIDEKSALCVELRRQIKSVQKLYCAVWLEIAVLAFIIVMLAWTLFYAMDNLRDIANDNAQIVEIITEGGRA